MRDLRGCAAVVLPGDLSVPQRHHPTVLSVVALVAGAPLTPDIKDQLSVIVDPEPLPLPPWQPNINNYLVEF